MLHTRIVLGSLITAALGGALASCSGGGGGGGGVASSPKVETFDPDVATQWFDRLYLEVKASGTAPPQASRMYGYAALALYEGIVTGMPDHNTLQGQLEAFPAGTIPAPTNAVHDWPSVANRALSVVCTGLLPAGQVNFDALEAQIAADVEVGLTQVVIDRSVQYGEDVGNAILAFAATDGVAGLAACNGAFVPPITVPNGAWTGTGLGLQPCWGTLRTFALTAADECAAFGHPAYDTATTSAIYSHALVVYNTTGDAGANLTADQTDIANYWADGATATGTPGGHWISIVRVVAAAEGLKLDVVAEAYARVGIAIHDAFIACWDAKFDTYLLRPVTYIRDNIDAGWDPLLTTPNFPTYTSGHSTQSGAASTVLTGQFGSLAFTDTTHSDLNPALAASDRSFGSFAQAANEAAISRLYGGIHWLFDNIDGYNQGQCIGEIINSRVQFRD